MNTRRFLISLAAIAALAVSVQTKEYTILSPDKELSVTLSDDTALTYSVALSGTTVLERSPLGIYCDDVAYPCAMTVSRALAQRAGTIDYDNPRDNCYQIKVPEDGHNMTYDPTWAAMDTPCLTPWRIMAISRNIGDIVATTLSDDLVEPQHASQVAYQPGKAAWSWLFYADAWTTYDGSRKFIDMAAELGFGYCLIDAFWDQWIGRERIAELSAYAQQKGVRLLLWYNSNGNWNGASYLSPTNIMNNAESRRAEMEWMCSIGVAGVKVDFYPL
ncbi:MAG: glycoside hydrolase family 97 catalytic domain-containing protein [Muribaculaceae bacterium]